MPDFPPDIDDYLEQVSYNSTIDTETLKDLVYKIVVHTGYSYETASVIVRLYFQELRTEMLKGNIIKVGKVGLFYIRCPRNGKSKKRIDAIIKPSQSLKNKVKYDE